MARTTQERKRTRSRRGSDEQRPRRGERDERERERDEQERDESRDAEPADGGSGGGVFGELRNVASDAALAVLAPVAKEAVTKAAEYALKKGPSLLEDTVKPALEDAGGASGLVGGLVSGDGPASGLLSKVTGTGGGKSGAGDGTGKGRRMPVQQAVDVAAPIDVVYDQWTQFEDYPKFMHRVQRVEQRDDAHVAFHAKVWGVNRMWEAEIVEQRPDERIIFKSVNGVQLTGVVTFHDLAERLTRIELNVDLEPDGPIEKIARGARFVKRATRGDLKRFKAFVEMREDETGAWRGAIEDGEVVDDSYDDDDYDEYDDEEREEDDERDEPVAEEPEEDDEPDEEPEPPKRSRQRSKSRSRGSSNGGEPKRASRSRGASNGKKSRGSSKSKSSSRRRS